MKSNNSNKVASIVLVLLGTLSVKSSFAETAEVVVQSGPKLIGGLSATSFYVLTGVILLELAIIFMLLYAMRSIIKPSTRSAKAGLAKEKKKRKYAWLERLNNTKSVDAESEAAISLNHNYDGIGELDNPTPPWWKWGFRLSIVFAFVYMWVYFVAEKAPLQLEELAIANEKAERAREAYLANAGNRIDENNVELITDADELEIGRTLYVNNCSACHLDDGGGSIGPNLADQYWLHGGHINDIFKSIKYGIAGTGMKSWENDFSPKQIAQIASFVHSLRNTTPRTAKEPEGELYMEDVAVVE